MENKITHLTTDYADKMSRELPWSDYPRPSMVRDSYFCLNGIWDFATAKDDEEPVFDQEILVPFCPESILSGIGSDVPEKHLLHYRRKFSLPKGFVKERTLLHFGAVDTICEVTLNGISIGKHEGGYLPFSFDVTDVLKEENELYVKVRDDLDKTFTYGKQTKKRGGMWYTPVSGIWQTVWLESLPENYITGLKIDTDMTSVKIKVLGGTQAKRLTIHETNETFDFVDDDITVTPSNIRLWSPERPNLYSFTVESGLDKVHGYFALREISIKEVAGIPRLCLNGEPYLFNGLLDQGYFPDGLFLPATLDGYRDDIKTAKSLGFNTLRKHIKVEPEIF